MNATQKHAQAQNNLGAMDLEGQGVVQNDVRAHMGLNFAGRALAAPGQPQLCSLRV